MKYKQLISFNPITTVIQLTDANDVTEEEKLVRSYVMSDEMEKRISDIMLGQLQFEEYNDNKGIFLVGNYGTGKSHLMSLISAVAHDPKYLSMVQNQKFAEDAKIIAGRFEVLRIEIGASTMSLRDIIFSKIKDDFKARGIDFSYPAQNEIVNNKGILDNMMALFAEKYGEDKGYMVVIDEVLDYLKGRKNMEAILDFGFLRELGESCSKSKFRIVCGVQEQVFDNPSFSFLSETLNHVHKRFEQMIIQKQDTAYVVSERILKKNSEQKAWIRNHLQNFCSLYSNMAEDIERYVELFPIHPSYIEVFNKMISVENREVLKSVSQLVQSRLDDDVDEEAPCIISFDTYWPFIKSNSALRSKADIKEVIDKSGKLEDIITHSFPKKLYKPLAIKIIYALSVHRLTTGDISIRSGLTAENLRDDLCLFLNGMPDQSSETLQGIVQVVLKDIMTTVSGQFVEHNDENGQYYLDLKKDIDYDEKITQRAATIDDDQLNRYFNMVVYTCLDWDAKEKVTNFNIYEHTLNWASHNIFRRGYLFLGTPENRPTAQPPEDYYIYFLPPYGDTQYSDEKKPDEVFFSFKHNEEFKGNLRLYAAALMMKEMAEEKNKPTYAAKAEVYRKKLTKYFSDNKSTCFEVIYQGEKRQLLEVLKGQYKIATPFKETMDLAASISLDNYFATKYPLFPKFRTQITVKNQAEVIRAGFDRFAGKQDKLADYLLDSFDLIDNGKITVANSRYAKYYIDMLNKLPAGSVINFSDIYEETFDGYVDKKFKVSYALMPVVFFAMVYTGNCVIAINGGKTITASDLDTIPKTSVMDIYDFKYISKPKDVQLAELIHLFEVLNLPTGLMTNPAQREAGLAQLLEKAKDIVTLAVKAANKLNGDFSLWGEKLIPDHIVSVYKESGKRVLDMFSNFGSRFNTVAKLPNFLYTKEEIDQIDKDIQNLNVIMEYEAFRTELTSDVSYMMNLERMELGKTISGALDSAKDKFREIRDAIPEDMDGEGAASDVKEILEKVKKQYIDLYFEEHNKKRLNVVDAKKKGEIISSTKLGNLKKLKALSIFSAAKVDAIDNELASLKVCYDLTTDMLKTTHFCTKCNFVLGGSDVPVKGKIADIEDRIDSLLADWSQTLYNTLSDPLLGEQMAFLKPQQRTVIDQFLKTKKLPEKVDNYFVDAVSALLEGFEPVSISAEEFIDKLDALGPCDIDTFKNKINELLKDYTKGKDAEKLRIIVKR